jgi:superoxide dismutase, Fe-Mn family
MSMNRRQALTAAGSAALLVAATGGCSMGNKQPAAAAPPPQPPPQPLAEHAVVPLPFDPTKLRGISEQMIVSHHDNNYAGAVKNLNKVEQELARVTKDSPGFLVAGLKERELVFTNSMILHEHYFANLGGDGTAAGGVANALAATYGTLGAWEEKFRAAALSLGGGSGWVILDFNFHTRDLRTYWSGNHSQSVAFGHPLLVLDMYEHAYAIDYGAGHAKYVDAFFANLRWAEVDRRYQRALKAFG